MPLVRVLACCVLFAASAQGQALDVGGFEIRLRTSFDSTARRLSAVYELQYLEGGVRAATLGKIWWIRRRDADRTVLGTVDEKDGRVVGVTRDWTGSSDQLSAAFVAYWREAQRLGGSDCVTTPDFVLANGAADITHITGYTTKCGRYRLQHSVVWPPYVHREGLKLSLW